MLQKIWNRIPLIYALAVIVLIIAPLLYISRYNHAGADDFEVSGLLVRTQSIWQTAMALMKRSAAYTGVLVQALFQPADVQGIGFRLVPIGVVLLYLVTFYAGITALLPRHSTASERGVFMLACFAVFFRLMESPMQTIFWSMSAIGYTSGYALAILFIALLTQYLCIDSSTGMAGKYAMVIVAMLLAMGSLPVVSLLTVGLCAGALLYALLNGQRQKWPALGFLLLLALLVLAYLLTAPGTARRISEGGHQGLVERPVLSLALFAFNMYRDYLARWFSDSLFLLSSVAFIGWLAERRVMPQLRLPLWLPFVATFAFGYLWFFIPKLLVNYIASRQIDTGLVFFITGWILSLMYLAAFLQRQHLLHEAGRGWRSVVFGAMLLTLLLPQYVSNMRHMWVDIRSGSAARHDLEITRRYQMMHRQRAGNQLLVLDTLQAMPLTIWKGDFIPDTSNWANRSFARYFGHTTISVKQGTSAHIQKE